ncbi:MAG: hypothetical protein GKS01_17775 [Alphaproteobacteria bacterium]|nr:hypothetical protein [Alphaproteobacteria bacterium]
MAQDSEGLLDQYRKNGYAVARGVFDPYEVAELTHAFERVHNEAMMLGRSYRLQNAFFKITNDDALRPVVRYVQWPSYFNRTLDRYRRSPRILKLLAPMLGINLKQFTNQMHWKHPGTAHMEFGYHQDSRSHIPRDAFRDLANSNISTGIAIDAQDANNGAMVVYPGSQTLGELPLNSEEVAMDQRLDENDLEHLGLDPDKAVTLEMEPGDVAIWSVHTLHGSGPNRSNTDRRFYINDYVIAENSDRGEWAFRNGVSQPLSGRPALVDYDDLYEKPGPMFVD